MRCFIGIDVEGEDAKKAGRVGRDAKDFGIRGKFVDGENLHVNLRFFPDGDIGKIGDGMKRIEFRPFRMKVEGLETFGGRVLFLRVSSPELDRLNLEVEKVFGRAEKAFVPHITLCRLRSEKRVKEFIRERKIGIESFGANKIRLKESFLTPKGPVYRTLVEK